MSRNYTAKGATISPCGKYRYDLWREWEHPKPDEPWCVFSGLNPSKADGKDDDPTIRREVDFAERWGFKRYAKVNAYGLRSTDPTGLWTGFVEPVGAENDSYIRAWAQRSARFVGAWGDNVQLLREHEVKTIVRELGIAIYALRLTKRQHPQHPLRLRADTEPFVWLPGKVAP